MRDTPAPAVLGADRPEDAPPTLSATRGARSRPLLADVLLAAGVICIGFSAIFVRLAGIPGISSAFYRVFVASLALIPLSVARRPVLPSRSVVGLSILAGVLFGLDLSFWNVAVMVTKATNATLLAYLAPIWVGLGAQVLLGEKLKKTFWPGTAIALLGMLVIFGAGLRSFRFSTGDLLAAISSFFYAGYLLVSQSARAKVGTLTFTALSVFSSTAVLFVIALVTRQPLGGFSGRTWLSLAALGLISHLGGWLSINYALGHIKASVTSVTLLGQPVITALAALIILGEPLGLPQILGGLLILPGIYLVNR